MYVLRDFEIKTLTSPYQSEKIDSIYEVLCIEKYYIILERNDDAIVLQSSIS